MKDVYYNQAELQAINSGKKEQYQIELQDVKSGKKEQLDGGAFFVPLLVSALSSAIGPLISKAIRGGCNTESGSPCDKNKYKKMKGKGLFTDVGKQLAKELGKKTVDFATQKVSSAIKKKIGGGSKKCKTKKMSKKSDASDKRSMRGKVISKIMKQFNMDLPTASKYIKENKIAY